MTRPKQKTAICRLCELLRLFWKERPREGWIRGKRRDHLPGNDLEIRTQRKWWSESDEDIDALPTPDQAANIVAAVVARLREDSLPDDDQERIGDSIVSVFPHAPLVEWLRGKDPSPFIRNAAILEIATWQNSVEYQRKHFRVASKRKPKKAKATEGWFLAQCPSEGQYAVANWRTSEIEMLLRHFWLYPEKVHPSWSIGEKQLLNGDDENAFSQCDHTVSLHATELAHSFPEHGRARVQACADWLISQTTSVPGYLVTRSQDGNTESFPDIDLKRTAALGTILARKLYRHDVQASQIRYLLADYLDHRNGGALFLRTHNIVTLAHCLEFVGLYKEQPECVLSFPDDGVTLLTSSVAFRRIGSGLGPFVSGALNNPMVDAVWLSLTLIDRIVRIGALFVDHWQSEVHRISAIETHQLNCRLFREFCYVLDTVGSPTWLTIDAVIRFRMECRVAAIVRVVNNVVASWKPSYGRRAWDDVSKKGSAFLENWLARVRDECSVTTLPNKDIATLIYLIRGLLSSADIKRIVSPRFYGNG